MDRLFRSTQAGQVRKDHDQNPVTTSEEWVVDVVKAEYVEAYKLRILFSDGTEQVVDFGPFLQASNNPLIRKYLQPDLFRDFTVEHGDLFWHDYDLCFPIADLYTGDL
jgi:hypothetical protein